MPGCDPVKYWYDEANRIQSEQDGHLRSQSLYRNYSYDAIGRLTMQTVGTDHGDACQTTAAVTERRNCYGSYSCCQEFACLFPEWADSINAISTSAAVARGRLTATLEYTSNKNKFIEIFRYDADGRVCYKFSAYAAKWMKTVHTTYNFVGDVLDTEERVYTYSNGIVLLARRRTSNTYHPGTRLLASTTLTHTDKNGNTSTQAVSNPAYDVFGNVTANDRPGTAADMAYSYDTLHGWLKGVSSPCGFSEQLQRETAANAQFSGNIGSMQWRNTSNGEQHNYDYTYDGLGRLTDALYSSSADGTSGHYDESVSYNSNGSITTLLRNGMRNDGTFGAIDDLSIDYDGNRLLKVTDDAEALNYNGALDFNDGDDADCEYRYDSNGALTYDGNRGISSISYDYGHHPRSISLGTKKYITNDYTPDGRKLSSQHVAYVPKGNGANRRISIIDLYIDGLILRKGTPLLWQFNGGYVDLDDNGSPTGWNYYVTDHLGSTRMVVDSNNNIRETINYYPFGSEMRMENPAQMADVYQHPYRFTGKELDRLNGLNMYDFGARWYDVAGVPMWTSVDPLAEKYYLFTPYSYCAGDPVNKFDPDGKQPVKYIDSDGNKHISWSIVVMVKALKSGASQNRINRHEKYKKNLKDKYSKQFNHYLNGDGAGVINSSEERIISDFKITVVDVGDSYDLKEAKKLSKEYGQEIKEESGKNGNAAVFMEGSTNGALGLTKQASLITIALNAPEGTESHELFHTSGIGDNGYTHGGILNSPPEPIKPEEVDKLWDVLPERK